MASEVYVWRPRGSKVIAKFVPDGDVKPGSTAPLNQGEFCAYQQDRTYVGTYNESSPVIKPKRGIASRLIGRASPPRDHLFAAQGPHKVELSVKGEWISGETGSINAFLDVSVSENSLGKMFNFASQCTNGEITPEALASEVQTNIQAKFNSHVMNLGSRPSTKSDVESQDTDFEIIADEILGAYGFNCTNAILNYMPSREQTAAEAEADAQQLADLKATDRARAAIESRDRSARGRSELAAEVESESMDMARQSERMARAKERIARRAGEMVETTKIAEIEAQEDEIMTQLEIERQKREAKKTQAALKSAKELSDQLGG